MSLQRATINERTTLNHGKAGNGGVLFFQPKLTINQPNDVYEQEADMMADNVMRMPNHSFNDNAFFKPAIRSVQRKCHDCEEENKMLHRKESSGNDVMDSNHLDNYVSSLSSSGQPLPETNRMFFEPRFGHDFSDVRVHTDAVAAKSAQSINALAYTTGNNIVFNQGQYSTESESGKKLMAHELTHVIQQQNTQISPKTIQRQDGKPDDNKLQITKSIELAPPPDKLSTVLTSPENKDAEKKKAHPAFDFSTSVSPNPPLDPTPQTYAFSLVYRDFNIHEGSDDAPISTDFLHEPNFQLMLSPDPHNAQIYQAAISLVNIHFRRHKEEFIELGLSPQATYARPSGTLSGGAQLQVELHITSNFSITASSSIGVSKHDPSAPPDLSSIPLGTTGGADWTWAPISVSSVWHF
jgi:hypothetical protein